nr:protein phosphatase 1 regulatory subunit 21-like [Parasteatoda tepidariorum]
MFQLEISLRESIQQLKVIPLNFENIVSAIKAETLTWDKSPVKNFCLAFQRYEKYLDKMLPFLILRIQNKESWTSSKMVELVPKLIVAAKKLMSCFKKLFRYIQLLSCIGSSEKDIYHASQTVVVKKIFLAVQSLHTLLDDTRKLFGSKIALDHQLPTLSDSEKSTDDCILSTLVSVASTSKKLADLMETNIGILSSDVWYKPKFVAKYGKVSVSPCVWQFKERGCNYLQRIAQEESPSIPYEVALKNYQTLCDHADNRENLTQQLEEYQNKLMQLELDKENWMLECELMKVKSIQDPNSEPGSPQMKLQDYDEIHLFVKNTVNQLIKQIQFADSKAIAFKNECETLHQRLKMSLEKKEVLESEVLMSRKEVDRLKEEQKTLMQSYDEQLNTMSEHLANLNETLTAQKDEIDALKHSNKVSHNIYNSRSIMMSVQYSSSLLLALSF